MKECIDQVCVELKGNLIMISENAQLLRAWEVSNLTAVDEFRNVVKRLKVSLLKPRVNV